MTGGREGELLSTEAGRLVCSTKALWAHACIRMEAVRSYKEPPIAHAIKAVI